ncbi:MAG: ECF transporter S component [Suipraeoptans sp.]
MQNVSKTSNVSNTRSRQIVQMTQLAVLIAILAILTLTGLGFITTGVVSITILHIPVIIGSLVLGPKLGGILGFAFGFLSMINATFRGATPVDMMFTPAGGHGMPIQSLILVFVPRIILGILPALIFSLLSKWIKKEAINAAIAAGLSTMVHTVMVLGLLYFMFFSEMTFSEVIKTVFLTVIGLNGILEIAAAVIICSAVSIPLRRYLKNRA